MNTAAPTNQYDGEYANDRKNGYGVFAWESGNIYKGNYVDDEREGYGEMFWTDGSIYQGEWKAGIQHGYGKMTFPDGSVKEGQFENNMYIGPAVDSETPLVLFSEDEATNKHSAGGGQPKKQGAGK